MLPDLPTYIINVFLLTLIVTLGFWVYIMRRSSLGVNGSNLVLIVMLLWLQLQLYLTAHDFYSTHTHDLPPRFLLLVGPPLLTILLLFVTKRGRAFIDSIPLVPITWLCFVRIPVELCLYWLSLHKFVPELMTFDGRNFDILSGLSAPFIAYSMQRGIMRYRLVLMWNVICLLLLLNVVINAVLSAPFTFQQFAFDQPNVAILYFPFSWLPGFIVPIILFTHLVSIRRILLTQK